MRSPGAAPREIRRRRLGFRSPRDPEGSGFPARGFTLIEVIGAILVFAVGVLMAARLSGVLSTQIETSALRSEVVVVGQEVLDSLSVRDYAEVAVGTTVDTLTLRGKAFERTVAVSQVEPRLREVEVTVFPLVAGPAFSATSYLAEPW